MTGIESANMNENETGVLTNDAELTIHETLERMKKMGLNATIGMLVDKIRRTPVARLKLGVVPHPN